MGFDYRKVGPTLWTGVTGRWLRKQPPTVTVVAMYLMTCPSSTQWGLFYLPRVYIANDTGRSVAEVNEALSALEQHGFCRYDDEAEVVWVVNMCRDQVGEIRGGDKRAKPALEAARELLDMPFGGDWCRHYQAALQLPECPIDAPSMPHPEVADAPSMPGAGTGEKQEQDKASLTLVALEPPWKPDFEPLYRDYPLKLGKDKGMAICRKQIRTPADFEALRKAIANYAAIVAGADPKFTKHFSSFMNCWRDYVDALPSKPLAAAPPVDRLVEAVRREYAEKERLADERFEARERAAQNAKASS